MGGSKSKAPEQPTTTTNMGQFGSTTTSKTGSTWNPTAFQTQFVNNSQDLISNAQNALDRKSTRLNSSHTDSSRMPSSA